jgi:hypothetical protein
LHVPLVISGPNPHVPGKQVRHDLVNLLDVCATSLAWAGIERPDWYEGQDLFGPDFQPREFVASAKDRMDHTIDRVRTVRTDRYRYTRNYKLDRIFLQPQYRDSRDYVINLRDLYAKGELSSKLTEIYFGPRPAEELYDVSTDPHQLNNLATDPAHSKELQRHRKLLEDWLAKGDRGATEEDEAELKYQADGHKWGRGVNPEYEPVRNDSDGDGLSDQWEEINGRDPQDGRLVFEFNCGAWQTEGWETTGTPNHLPGNLGFLHFTLEQGAETIQRGGLAVAATKNDKALLVKVRTSKQLQVQASANGKTFAAGESVAAGAAFVSLSFPLADEPCWQGVIGSLEIEFRGPPGTVVEIDSISIDRSAP